MKPLIGLTAALEEERGRLFLNRAYVAAVQASGGRTVILPVTGVKEDIEAWIHMLDGLVLTGGGDVDPVYFDEEPRPGCGWIDPERDFFELSLVRLALAAGLPVLGICRGLQVLNIAAGGDIYQDINTQVDGCLKHSQQAPRRCPTHLVQVVPGSRLAGIAGTDPWRVNSFHHQAVRRVAAGFAACARAADGIVEAMEKIDHSFVLGVQWHPEAVWEQDTRCRQLFGALVEAGHVFRPGKTK